MFNQLWSWWDYLLSSVWVSLPLHQYRLVFTGLGDVWWSNDRLIWQCSTEYWFMAIKRVLSSDHKVLFGDLFFFSFFFFQGWIHFKIQRLQSEDVERSLSVRDTTVSFSESQSLCCEMLKFKWVRIFYITVFSVIFCLFYSFIACLPFCFTKECLFSI